MTDVEELQSQARRIGVLIDCPECDFEETLADFLDRDDRVDEEAEEVIFGCPACGSVSVDLARKVDGGSVVIVDSIEELEAVAGE
mgnify:CR=1 FL=1